ncbi:MAG: AbrB/MazE/SpoVT family DNA-binding domain-containing protein [Pseudomonadales bacterium]
MSAKKQRQSILKGSSRSLPVKKKSASKPKTTTGNRTSKPRQSAQQVAVHTVASGPTEQVRVDNAGRIVVPARFRKSLGLASGDPVTISLEGDVLRIRTLQVALEKARAVMRKKNPKKRSAVDELIAERRAEAAKE